ncbi:MAG: hypothetical protein ABEJ71_04720 [Halodesulfurarchaeum sp.]
MSTVGGDGEMTLAFELAALQALAEPSTAFADARQWTRYVGVVSDEPTYVVTNYTRKRRIRTDFFSGPRGKEGTLENVKGQFEADRYVFVGTGEEDEEVAKATGWEYLPIEEAAEAAEWTLATEADGGPEQGQEEQPREDWP